MPILQYTGPRSPEENPGAFIAALRKRYANISVEDIRGMYTKAVMFSQAPAPGMSVAIFGRDILTEDIESMPWWKYLNDLNRNALRSHPVDSGLAIEGGLKEAKRAMLHVGGGRSGINRASMISIPGLENTYVWCKMNGWKQDVSPRDLALILSQKDKNGRKFIRSIRVIDDHGPYAYVRPYGEAHVRERFEVKNGDDFEALKRDQSSKPHFQGFDAPQE